MAVPPTRRPGLRVRPEGTPRATYLLREGVFVAPLSGRLGEGRRVGSLHGYLEALLARRPSPGAAVGGVLGEALNYARHLQVLRFCLNELTPHLRSCGGTSGRCREGAPPLPARTFKRLDGWALELLRGLDGRLPPLESLEALDALLKVPAVISGGMLIPISPVPAARPPDLPIAVGGTRHLLRAEEARPFEEVLGEIRREQKRCLQRSVKGRRALTRMASKLLAEVKSVLQRCAPQDCGSYQLFYRDGDHQLQHSRGHWILIRGPVVRRLDERTLFVGLHLAGRTRREWLSVAPRPGRQQGAFWAPGGGPLQGGVCMGQPRQYRWLLCDHFTDAEAVVDWLDAGVILLTGRSELHRHIRAARAELLPDERVVIRRRSMR